MVTENEQWPSLPYEEWKDTYATLHMWTQIVGKIALAQAPPLNHSWSVAFVVTPRGLMTRTLPYEERTFTLEFDLIDHQLVIRTSDGVVKSVQLAPRSVASFYADVMATMAGIGLPVKIWPMTSEIPVPIRLDTDEAHHSYDPVLANRCWIILSKVARVFEGSRCDFVGKCSPVHFFWGGFDLAVTRFSGRPAPPREGPAFMREAYSHEVISHGFWFGSGPLLEPAFYAYAVPEPPGSRPRASSLAAPSITASWASLCCPTRRSANPTRRSMRSSRSSRAPTNRRRRLGDGTVLCSSEQGIECCAHQPDQRATETQRHGAERVARRLRRQRGPKACGNTSDRRARLAFPQAFEPRVSAGDAGRRATR